MLNNITLITIVILVFCYRNTINHAMLSNNASAVMQRHLANGFESKCQQNTKTIWPYSSSRSSILVPIESPHVTSY